MGFRRTFPPWLVLSSSLRSRILPRGIPFLPLFMPLLGWSLIFLKVVIIIAPLPLQTISFSFALTAMSSRGWTGTRSVRWGLWLGGWMLLLIVNLSIIFLKDRGHQWGVWGQSMLVALTWRFTGSLSIVNASYTYDKIFCKCVECWSTEHKIPVGIVLQILASVLTACRGAIYLTCETGSGTESLCEQLQRNSPGCVSRTLRL